MANVPTVSAPTVGPSLQRAPTPPAGAFAANVLGDALEGFAKVEGARSEDLAQHALQFQALNNKAEADTGFSTLLDEQNRREAEFKSTHQGLAAMANLPAEYAAIDAHREQVAASMSNPTARSMFEADSRIATAQTKSGLTNFAVAERKRGLISAASTVQGSIQSDDALHPENFTDNTAKFMQAQRAINDQLGLTEEEGQQAARVAYGKRVALVSEVLAGNGDINAAARFLDEHKDGMDGVLYQQTLTRLRPALMANDAADIGQRAAGSAVGGIASVVSTFAPPVSGPITSGFGARVPPGPGASANHQGTDFGVAMNTPVHATAAGVVSFVGQAGGYGNLVEITHSDGSRSRYGHLNAADVKVGQQVAQGAQIAESGRTGNATGPHLHFEIIRPDGTRVDPMLALRSGTSTASVTGGPLTSTQLQAALPAALDNARQEAFAKYPGNAAFADAAESRAQAELNQQIAARRGAEAEAYSAFGQAIIEHGVQDQATLLASVPNGLQLWNTLPLGYQTALTNSMKADANAMTPDRWDSLQELTGKYAQMQNNPGPFVNADIPSLNLPPKLAAQWIERQQKARAGVQAQSESDHTLNRALQSTSVGATFRTLDIQPGTPKYDQFVGALKNGIDYFIQTHAGKQPSDKEMMGVIANVTATTHHATNFLGMGGGDVAEFEVPKDAADAIAAEFQAKGRVATAQDVAYIYRSRRRAGRY